MFAVHCGPIGFNMSFLASNKAWNLEKFRFRRVGYARLQVKFPSVGAVHPKFGRFKSPCPKNKPYMRISFQVLVMFGYRIFTCFNSSVGDVKNYPVTKNMALQNPVKYVDINVYPNVYIYISHKNPITMLQNGPSQPSS